MKARGSLRSFLLVLSVNSFFFTLAMGCGGGTSSHSEASATDRSKPKNEEPTLDPKQDRKWAGNNGDERLPTFKKPQDTYFNSRATDIFSEDGKSFVQQGKTSAEANQRALALCTARTSSDGYGGSCVISKQFVAKLLPRSDGNQPAGWGCKVQENKPLSDSVVVNRSWAGPPASTIPDAMANAMKKCADKSGIECQIVKCVNTDFGKAETLVLADDNSQG